MAIIKRVESRKAVTVNYWRISSFSFSPSGNLKITLSGYKDGDSYSNGADSIDTYDVNFHNADNSIKTLFYDLVKTVDIFKGAEDELAYSILQKGPDVVTVTGPGSELIMRKDLTVRDSESRIDEIDTPLISDENDADFDTGQICRQTDSPDQSGESEEYDE